MNLILFDDEKVTRLYPFTLTRPAALIRCGISTITEKWESYLGSQASYKTAEYLSPSFPEKKEQDSLFINGRYLPDQALCNKILELRTNEAIYDAETLVAFRSDDMLSVAGATKIDFEGTYTCINEIHNIFTLNPNEIQKDFERITHGRSSIQLSASNTIFGSFPVFAEEGVKAEATVINASEGPVYLGKNAELMEGSLIRGPFALCDHATVKMGAKIYTGTTIGPHSKVGGEVSNSVIFAYSNKGHDGFLGNSVLGEWCNLGADTNNSNLKNNYEIVKLWNYATERFEKTGLQFCGLFMGDHSKCGINTMFNTGTVIGVSANIFGSGFPRNFVPSFAWGGAQGFETYAPAKAFKTAELVMERRHIQLSENDKNILQHIFQLESKYRNWE